MQDYLFLIFFCFQSTIFPNWQYFLIAARIAVFYFFSQFFVWIIYVSGSIARSTNPSQRFSCKQTINSIFSPNHKQQVFFERTVDIQCQENTRILLNLYYLVSCFLSSSQLFFDISMPLGGPVLCVTGSWAWKFNLDLVCFDNHI